MAADFNLSAAISLQLAAGAAAKLKEDIQKSFTASVELDTSKVKKAAKDAKKDLANTPIKVPISFIVPAAREKYAQIKKKIGAISVDVEFSKPSVKANLTQPKLLKILGERKFTIPVEVEYGKNTKATLNKITKQTNALIKEQKRLQDLINANSGGGTAPAPVGLNASQVVTTAIAKQSDEVEELAKRLSKLAKANDKIFGGSSSYGGGFFKAASNEIKTLSQELENLAASKGLKGVKGLDLISKKFEGLDGKSSKNLLGSLERIFNAYTNLDEQSKQLQATNKKFGGSFDISKQLAQIDSAKTAIGKLFTAFDSANPNTFGTSISAELNKVKKSTIDAEREMRSYSTFLSNLNQKKAGVTAGAGRQQTEDNIDALIREVEKQKASGASSDQIKSSAAFQKLNAVLGVLKYVDIAAQRAGSAIDAAVSKVNKGELKDTFGGRAVGLKQKIPAIGTRTNAALALTTDPKAIDKIKTEGLQDAAQLNQQAGDVQRQFQRLYGEIVKLQAANLDAPAKSLSKFIGEIYRLVQAGASLSTVDSAVSKKLAEVANVVGLEKRVNTAINQIERLRHALESSPVNDATGARAMLDNLDKQIRERTGQFKDLTPEKLTQGVSSALFDVRLAQRSNELIDSTVSKMKNLGEASENLAVGKIFSRNADTFEAAANRIAASSKGLGQKLKEIKSLADRALIQTKFDAEGGFFGSIAKSAGLATKRLAAFLIMAQGLYTVQAFLASALSEAVKIDKEFTKLEQVFSSEDLSNTALEQTLTRLNSQILTLGKNLGISTSEVANAAQILAQAGIKGEGLSKLLDVVAKSQLGPTFGSASETAEASIAIMNQFGLSIENTTKALGGINQLSKLFAVEAKGITEGVRRAGGVFASSGDDIASFASAFTLIKQKTRESDESIATGLRNIAQRLQSTKIQEKLKAALGVDLVVDDQFIGFEKSIISIGRALKAANVNEKSPLFAQVREIIGGQRQGGRANPLLQDFEGFEKLKEEFAKGANSIEEDVTIAFGSIENKIQRAKGAIIELYTEISRSEFVKFLVEAFTQITTFASGMLRTLNSVPGAIFAIGTAAKLLGNSRFIGQAVLSQIIPKTNLLNKNKGGAIGLNAGGNGLGSGLIPGRGPNKDSLLAYLTKGEYVIKRESVDKYGTSYLDQINSGRVEIANKGGAIRRNKGGIIPGFVGGGFIDKLTSVFISKATKTKNTIETIRKLQGSINKDIQSLGEFDRFALADSKRSQSAKDNRKEYFAGPKSFSTDPEQADERRKRRSSILSRAVGNRLEPKKNNVETKNTSGGGLADKVKSFLPKSFLPKSFNNFFTKAFSSSGGPVKQLSIDALQDDLGGGLAGKVKSFIPKSIDKFFTGLFKQSTKPPENLDFNYLEKELKDFGFSIKDLGKVVENITNQSEVPNSTASFNPKTKTIGVNKGGESALPHEVGHALFENKSKKQKLRIIKTLTKEDLEATKKRLIRDKDLYANPKTGKISRSTLYSEAVADKFDNLVSFKQQSSKKQRKNVKDFTNFNDFRNAIGNSNKSDTINSVTGKSTGYAKASGNQLEFNGERAERRKSASLIDKIRNQAVGSFSPPPNPSYPPPNGPRGPRGPNNPPPNGPRPPIPPFKHQSFQLSRGSGKLSKGLQSLTSNILSTKGGLIGLATAIFSVTGVIGQFNTGLSDLILAMTTASAGFLASASAGSSIRFAKTSLGIGEKKQAAKIAALVATKRATAVGAGVIGASSASLAAKNALLGAPALAFQASQSANAATAAAVARSAAQKSGTAAILANVRGAGAAPGIVGTAKSGAAAAALKASGVPAAAAAKALSGKLTVAAIGVGVLFGALDYFITSVEKGAEAELNAARTIEEAQRAKGNARFAGIIKDPISQAGTVVGAAITGASIGGVPGALVGAVIGGLIAFKDPILNALKSAAPGIYEAVKNNIVTPIKDTLSQWSIIIYALTHGIDAAVGSTLGVLNAFTLIAEKRRLEAAKQQKQPVKLSDDALKALARDIGSVESLINNLGGGKFSNLAVATQDEEKAKLQRGADVFNALGPEEQARVLDRLKKNAPPGRKGQDFEKIAAEAGIKLNVIENKAAAALDSLTIFFEKMKQITDLSSSRLDGLSGGLAAFSDVGNNRLFAPTQLLDIQAAGFDPAALGFGGFDQAQQNTNALIRSFDPRLADARNFENKTKKASRNSQQALLGNDNLKIDPATINDFIFDIFDTSSNGDIDANLAFDKFLEAKFEDVNAAINSDGKIDITKVNALFQEFSDSIGSAGSDQAKRIVDLSNQYYDSYKAQLAQRLALESQAIELIKNNVDKNKTSFDLKNTAQGLTGDALAAAQGQQAGILDDWRLGFTLQGTGLTGQATVAQMQTALLASQQRGASAGNVADLEIAGAKGDPAKIQAALTKKATTEAVEAERQNQYRAALGLVANGTESATHAMQEFERAAQKAATSSKFLSNALLGSDDQLLETVKGISALSRIENAYQKGGVNAARGVLFNLNESSRQALNQNISQDPDAQNQFNTMLGFGANIQAGPEFNAAEGFVQQQREANLALSTAITDSINPIIANTQNLQKMYESQFQGLQGVVAQAQQTADELVGKIAALPQVIKHEANVNLNIVGAGVLEKFLKDTQEGVRVMVEDMLFRGIEELAKQNAGLRVPPRNP